MSSSNNSYATKPVENAVYAKERAQQETSAAAKQAQTAAQPYIEQAKDALDNAGNVAGAYVGAAQQKLSEAKAAAADGSDQPQSYVDQAKSLAAATANVASDYAAGAANAAQGYVNAAQEQLSGVASKTGAAANEFQAEAAAHSDAAAREGQQDVEDAKQTGASYVDRARDLAGSALAGAQSYVLAGRDQLDNYVASHPPNKETTIGSVAATVHSATSVALDTTGQYLESAHKTLQPKADAVKDDIESALSSAQHQANVVRGYGTAAEQNVKPHLDAAAANAQQHLVDAQAQVQSQGDAVKKSLGSTS